jgi:mannose-6-phosphate isomerase
MMSVKPFSEKRPWGKFIQFTHDQKSTVKILQVNQGGLLSLQSHKKREEFWYVIQGTPTVVLGNKTFKHKPGDTIKVNKGQKHRIGNDASVVVLILEIGTGIFDEGDIIRYEDKYNRVK